jgi:hypothetical protein
MVECLYSIHKALGSISRNARNKRKQKTTNKQKSRQREGMLMVGDKKVSEREVAWSDHCYQWSQ